MGLSPWKFTCGCYSIPPSNFASLQLVLILGLRTLVALQQSFLEELEKTVALLAFEDVSNCPVGELLDISQRLKTASEVNAAILTSQSHEKG